MSERPNDALLSLEEASTMLNCSTWSLRRVVSKSKATVKAGQPPLIKFFQVGNGPIKFRLRWVREFIAANSVTEANSVVDSPTRKQRTKAKTDDVPSEMPSSFGLEWGLMDRRKNQNER